MNMNTDYHRALPFGDVKDRDEAEFRANGFVRPELRAIGHKVKHEIFQPDGITLLVAETQPSSDPGQLDYMNLKRHPIGAQYRDMTAVERDILEQDIAANGIRRALVLLDDAVFDGWQRYICGKAIGHEFTADDFVRYVDLYKDADPVAVADTLNLSRRHLTVDEITRRLERRIAAAKAEYEAVTGKRMPNQAVGELVKRDVGYGVVRISHNDDEVRKSRQYARKANDVADAVPAVDELLESNRLTNSDVASVASVEPEVIAAAAALVAEGQAKTLKQAVRRSRMERERTAHAHRTDEECDEREKANSADIDAGPTPRAALLSEEREQRQGADAERHRADMARRSSNKVELHHAGIAELHQHVAAGGVDIIYTEPPCEPDAVLRYADLGEFAAHALQDGGLLLVLSGAMYLPQLHRQLEGADGIQYRWQFVYSMPEASTPMREPRVHQTCQVLIAYSKGTYTGKWHADLITVPGAEEQKRQLRCWQQQVAGTIYALGRFVMPGLTVCDPMMGSGTTGVASVALGCAFIGSDSDPDCVTRVRKRINDARTAADGRPRPDQPPMPHFAEPAIRIRSHGESRLLAEAAVASV